MEDRYLFKAKRIDNGEWVYGSYVYTFCEDKNRIVVGVKVEKHWIVEESGNMVWVDKDTICQCTGFKDKNGKLIWENDIVRTCWQDNEAQCEEIAQIAWDEFGYYPWLDEYHCDGCDLFNEVLDIEVIGNIFDNKELLESEG